MHVFLFRYVRGKNASAVSSSGIYQQNWTLWCSIPSSQLCLVGCIWLTSVRANEQITTSSYYPYFVAMSSEPPIVLISPSQASLFLPLFLLFLDELSFSDVKTSKCCVLKPIQKVICYNHYIGLDKVTDELDLCSANTLANLITFEWLSTLTNNNIIMHAQWAVFLFLLTNRNDISYIQVLKIQVIWFINLN